MLSFWSWTRLEYSSSALVCWRELFLSNISFSGVCPHGSFSFSMPTLCLANTWHEQWTGLLRAWRLFVTQFIWPPSVLGCMGVGCQNSLISSSISCQLPVSACAESSSALHSVSAACFSMCRKLISLALSVSCLFQHMRRAHQPCTQCQLPVSACAESSSALHSVSAACFSMCEELISLALGVSCLF